MVDRFDFVVGEKTTITLEGIGIMPIPINLVVEYTHNAKESFYIPLRMMSFEKENPNPEIKRTILNDWAWANPIYTFTINKTNIKKITIDESGLMADVNKNNNSYPTVPAKK